MLETPLERIHREMREQFPHEANKLDRAVQAFEAGRAKLLRTDGTRIYADAEHDRRMAVLLADLDSTGETVAKSAQAAIEQGTADLIKLGGVDPLDSLKPEQQVRAAARREFVREDAESLPLHQIAERVTAVLAGDDRVMAVLWHRYLGRRLDAERERGPINPGAPAARFPPVWRELETRVMGDPTKTREQRQEIERRIESAKLLSGQVHRVRTGADGSAASREAAIRRQYASAF